MKRIFVPTISGSDWQRLLGKPKLHWKSGYSAMSAAACWEESEPQLPDAVARVLDESSDSSISNLEMLMAIPEWEVELPGGETSSQTDVLAITRNAHGLVILAVEAKVNEAFGPTLKKKKQDATPAQIERIAYLEKELGCLTALGDEIRYQLLHRTVSALLTARAFHSGIAVMLVHSFSPKSMWREDFEAFADALHGQRLTGDLYEIPRVEKPRLIIGWCKGDEKYLQVELSGAV